MELSYFESIKKIVQFAKINLEFEYDDLLNLTDVNHINVSRVFFLGSSIEWE